MRLNRLHSFYILIILLIVLTVISFFQYEKQKVLIDTGIRVEGKLVSVIRNMNSGRSIFTSMFKYKATYVFTAIDGKDYGVIYTTTDKSTITDKKIIYYNPYKVNQYTFEDDNPFGWLKEIFIAWTKALLIGFLLIFISSYITRE